MHQGSVRDFIASMGAPRVAPRRRHAEDERRDEAGGRGEREHARIQRQLQRHGVRGELRDEEPLPQCATATPAAAPMAASSRLSISSWRARRPRDAPSASRTPSWLRAVARASSRLAMLAQAISSTNPATAIRTSSGRE